MSPCGKDRRPVSITQVTSKTSERRRIGIDILLHPSSQLSTRNNTAAHMKPQHLKILRLIALASAIIPGGILVAYEFGLINKSIVDDMVNTIMGALPLGSFVESSNIHRHSRIYYAFAFPQISIFPILFICEMRNSTWFSTPYTAKQRMLAPVAAIASFAVGLIGLFKFEGQSTRYMAIGDSWGILAALGWVPFMAFSLLIGSAVILVLKHVSHRANRR